MKEYATTMEFRDNNPGAVQFGNFINYYSFNSAADRLKLLPNDNTWIEENNEVNAHLDAAPSDYLILDVGCNSGILTNLLYLFLKENVHLDGRNINILGIDIDPNLIAQAKLANTNESITYETIDVMSNAEFEKVVNSYLAAHGCGKQKFNAVCCFSITMWIHLNHHDSGLKEFLHKLTDLGELFIIEPQPWRCYQTAERRLKKSGSTFKLFNELKWRSQVEQEIQTFLEMYLGRRKVYECDSTKWKRKICFYR